MSDTRAEGRQWPVPMTHEALHAALMRLRDYCALDAQHASTRNSGTGSWWELGGYADGLSDLINRIDAHRKRVVRQDGLLAARVQERD